ncbi:ATP-dependent DNA ligase [Streptomyces sp. NPDC004311]
MVSADRAIDHSGIYRRPLRFRRLRMDVTVDDVPRV